MGRAPTAPDITDVDFLEEMLEEAQERAAREVGVAGVNAMALVLRIKGQLDAARLHAKAEAAGKEKTLSEAELRERYEVVAPEMPLAHLEIFVRNYCERTRTRLVANDPVGTTDEAA